MSALAKIQHDVDALVDEILGHFPMFKILFQFCRCFHAAISFLPKIFLKNDPV